MQTVKIKTSFCLVLFLRINEIMLSIQSISPSMGQSITASLKGRYKFIKYITIKIKGEIIANYKKFKLLV
jgi:hypothetical protein